MIAMPPYRFHMNRNAVRRDAAELPPLIRSFAAEAATAEAIIGAWPGYEPTPLRALPALAGELGIGELLYKDEAPRFGLGSFKALGGAYAVYWVLADAIGAVDLRPADIGGKYKDIARGMTVASATAGNHGRSVAWGARLFGCRAVIFIHSGVGDERARAIARYGAEVVRVEGDYDESVRVAAARAAEEGWQVVSDTSYPGYTEIPTRVMQGYTVLFREVEAALPPARQPTHIFVQGGVGGLAGSAAAYFAARCGRDRPTLIVVEPEHAACLLESAVAGEARTLRGNFDTFMLGMACGEPSLVAWDILNLAADAFVTIPDAAALGAMRTLNGHADLVAGECAGAGLAALRWLQSEPDKRDALSLDSASRVLLVGTEGATDPSTFARLMAPPT